VARHLEPDELTDDEIVARLQAAARDEQEDRLVRCDSAEELRAFFASMGAHPSSSSWQPAAASRLSVDDAPTGASPSSLRSGTRAFAQLPSAGMQAVPAIERVVTG